jgi:hypothetical protein
VVAVATIAWMLLHHLWNICTACRPAPAPDAQAGLSNVALNNSGSS